jgi:hypothetical protein
VAYHLFRASLSFIMAVEGSSVAAVKMHNINFS